MYNFVFCISFFLFLKFMAYIDDAEQTFMGSSRGLEHDL